MGLPKVLITGITGHLGSHVGKTFLNTGRYEVIGTVRDKARSDKIDPLRKAYGDTFSKLNLVEADLKNDDDMGAVS